MGISLSVKEYFDFMCAINVLACVPAHLREQCGVSGGTSFEFSLLGTNHGGTFVDLMCVPVYPKKLRRQH